MKLEIGSDCAKIHFAVKVLINIEIQCTQIFLPIFKSFFGYANFKMVKCRVNFAQLEHTLIVLNMATS